MNKLFSKIAALSVGLAMAVGVGVALGHQSVKEAKAASGSVTIDYTTVDDRVAGYTNSQMSYAHTTDGATATITAKQNDSNQTVQNYYPGTSGKSYKQTRFYAKQSLDFSVVNSSSVSMYITSIVVTSTTENYSNAMVGATWTGVKTTSKSGSGSVWVTTIEANTNVTSISCTFSATSNATSIVVNWTSELVTNPEINVMESVDVGVGMSVEVPVSYANLASAISVTAPTGVTVPSSIDVSGSGDTTLEIQGDVAGIVDVVLSSGSASATIHVTVIQPTEYTLLTNLNSFTEGSQFTIVSLHEDTYYAPNSFGGSYYTMAVVNMMGEGTNKHFSSINAVTYTLVGFDEQGALIKEGDDYVGSTKIDGAGLTRNSDLSKITYNHWEINGIEEEIADLCLVGEEGDNNRFIKFNYNNGNPRIANYKTGFGSGVSIYASYLAPALYAVDNIRISTSESHNAFVTAVNFGGETITYNVSVEDESVATAVWSTDHAVITPVAAGNTTITISAQSENHGPVEVEIPLEVYDAARELESITLSVAEETLYKGQEFSYSGTVTANYSNGDHEVVSNPTFTGQDMSAVGDYEVTATFTDDEVTKTASYTLHVIQWEGALKLGSYYVIYSEYEDKDSNPFKQALTGVASNLGVASSYTTTLKSEFALYVEEGSEYNSYALKTSDGKYLAAANSNNLYANAVEEKTAAVSWTVTAVDETHYTIANVAYPSRSIQCNHNNGNPRFAAYGSTQKAVSLVEITTAEIASNFETNYMHKEIPTDNHEDTNACRAEGEGAGSYYAYAKAAFNVMPEASRNYFLSNSEYAARLSAWATANGEELDSSNYLVPSAAESFFSSKDVNNNSYIIIIAISSVSVLSFGLALFLRKKRSK